MSAAGWVALALLGGGLSAFVWSYTTRHARRGLVEREHVEAARLPVRDAAGHLYREARAKAPPPAAGDGLAYDVPLSYDEAEQIMCSLRECASYVNDVPAVSRDALLYAELLEKRLSAPRAVDDA